MVILGRIGVPFGVHGWVKVHAFGDDPIAWGRMPKWWLGVESDWQAFEVEACSHYRRGLVAHFVGIEDRGAAAKLRGLYVAAPRLALPATEQGEYYWNDLIGLDVVNLAGEPLGKVDRLISVGAHPILCVRDGDTERLIPFVGQIVTEVNIGGGVIRAEWDGTW